MNLTGLCHLALELCRCDTIAVLTCRVFSDDEWMWFRNESAVHQYNKEPRADRSVLLSSTAMGASLSTPSPVRALIGQFDRLQLCSKEKKNVDEETSELPAKTPVIVSHQPVRPINGFSVILHVRRASEENQVVLQSTL